MKNFTPVNLTKACAGKEAEGSTSIHYVHPCILTWSQKSSQKKVPGPGQPHTLCSPPCRRMAPGWSLSPAGTSPHHQGLCTSTSPCCQAATHPQADACSLTSFISVWKVTLHQALPDPPSLLKIPRADAMPFQFLFFSTALAIQHNINITYIFYLFPDCSARI